MAKAARRPFKIVFCRWRYRYALHSGSLRRQHRQRTGGADRLELCADLIIGGTTPSPALLRQVKAETGLPVRALLRPRFGDFCYDRYELAQMAECAAELVAAGADGIVTGVLTPAGALDTDALRPIYAAARQAAEKAHRTVDCTLHRAFDVCCDPFAALEAAKQLGLATILTSGQAASAPQGAALLRGRRWRFWLVQAYLLPTSPLLPPRPVPGRSTFPASRCWTAA